MEQQAYYRDVHNAGCDIHSDAEPLQVNCTGYLESCKPFRQPPRNIRQDFYLQYVMKGRLCVHSFGETQDLLPGMFTLYRPHTPFSYELMPGDVIGYYWVHFTGFHAGRLLSNLGIVTDCISCTKLEEQDENRVEEYFAALFSEFANRRPGYDDACCALLSELLVTLARGMEREGTKKTGRELCSVAYLHSHYRENTRVAELAAMEHLSESRYRDVFRRHTGFSPGDYRTALRMQHACDLLAMTDLTITEIAAECGYADVLYFLRIFKYKKGIPPGEYREKIKNGK